MTEPSPTKKPTEELGLRVIESMGAVDGAAHFMAVVLPAALDVAVENPNATKADLDVTFRAAILRLREKGPNLAFHRE